MNIHHIMYFECAASYNGTPAYVPGDGNRMFQCSIPAFA